MEKFDQNSTELSLNFETLIDSHISPSKRPGKLFEEKNFPNKIIRVERADELLSKHNNAFEFPELVQEAGRLYRELEEKYGINVPINTYKIEKDKSGHDIVYCIVDRIEGKHLEEVDLSNEFNEQVETLYTSVARYFVDKQKEGGLYLWDINGQSQYIYGKKSGEQNDKIYLIDTDIWMSRSRTGMYLVLEWLTRHMSGMEARINKRFEKAREYIKQLIIQPLEELSESDRDMIDQNVDRISRLLDGERVRDGSENAIPPFE